MNQPHQCRGFFLMAVSAILFSVMSLMIKLAPGVSTPTLAGFRFAFAAMAVLVLMAVGATRPRFVSLPLLVLRGVIGGASVLLLYISIVKVGLAASTVLYYTYPLFAAVLAPFTLGERVGRGAWAACVVGLGGAYLVVMHGRAEGATAAAFRLSPWNLVALGAGITSAAAVLMIRRLRSTQTTWMILLSQAVFGLAAVGALAAGLRLFGGPAELWPSLPRASAWPWLLAVAAPALGGQILMTYSYGLLPAAEGSLIALLSPVGNVILGTVFLGERMSGLGYFGTVVVILACGLVGGLPGRRLRPR